MLWSILIKAHLFSHHILMALMEALSGSFLCRERDDDDSDVQDLVMSFSGLEEKVLAQYTFAKVRLVLLSLP